MYENLIGRTIDKTLLEFEDFPEVLHGEVYDGGDSLQGWLTRKILTAEEAGVAQNAPILAALEEIDRKSIRPLRDGDTVRAQALEAEAEALRAQLL